MFQFPSSPPVKLWIHLTVTTVSWLPGFPIRTSTVLRLFAPTRGFSQLVTSFFGSQCQGIPPVLLVAWPYVLSLLSHWFSVSFRFIFFRQRLSCVSLRVSSFLRHYPHFFLFLSSHLFRYFRIFSSQGTFPFSQSLSLGTAGGDNEIRTHDPLNVNQVL